MEKPSRENLETPAALVDLERVEANLRRVDAYARQHGLRWRPHTKTHKVPELTALQLQAGDSGATVATPHEAAVMASVASDVLLAPAGGYGALLDRPDVVVRRISEEHGLLELSGTTHSRYLAKSRSTYRGRPLPTSLASTSWKR